MFKVGGLGKIGKKKIIFLIIIILLLLIGGVFWWQEDKIESFLESKKLEKMVAPSKDYAIVEDPDGKFIINRKDGFRVKIPTGWEVELENDIEILKSDREVFLHSKDFSSRPPEGCLIRIQVNRLQKTWVEEYNGDFEMYPFEGVEEVKKMINYYKEASPEEKEVARIISVDQKEALQKTIKLKDGIGRYVSIKIPTENKVYIFESTLLSDECDAELSQFLETVSID